MRPRTALAANRAKGRRQGADFWAKKQTGRADALPFLISVGTYLLAAVDGLLQVRAGGKLCYATGSNFEGGPGLRIASIARLPLRDGECTKPDQSDAIAFF